MSGVEIKPIAILAAVLFNAHSKMKVVTKADDGAPDIVEDAPMVNVQVDGDSLVCTIPVEELVHFATTAYQMQVQFVRTQGDLDDKRAMAIIAFEKNAVNGAILATNGKPITRQSDSMKRALERIK